MKPALTAARVAALSRELLDHADPDGVDELLSLVRFLYRIGRRDLPLGRLLEGHVDAVQIVMRYGNSEQARMVIDATHAGETFGVWNADHWQEPLVLVDGRLTGSKAFASGAGLLSKALVTVDRDAGRQLILVDLSRAPPDIDRSWWRVTGMQRSETHIARWTGQAVDPSSLIGQPGDYVREPWFTGGALRFVAVQAGGIAAVCDQVRDHLVAQDRAGDPRQKDRVAEIYLAAQSAALAVRDAAMRWDRDDVPGTLVHVAAARAAAYAAAERAIVLAQAAVGVSAMFVDHPLAETLNDLSVYLRQPGPDAQRTRIADAVVASSISPSL